MELTAKVQFYFQMAISMKENLPRDNAREEVYIPIQMALNLKGYF